MTIWRALPAALAISSASPAVGREPPVVTLEHVIVTGSHIRQIETEDALPVRVISRAEIEKSGATTLEQLLERVPAHVNAVNLASSVGDVTRPGLSSANLRGLGGGATLVLLNGRRLANYAFDGEAVDLNAIPLAAVERIEILKDGASAIYGTDAIAGVVNFILRKDYVGAQIATHVAVTQRGGGDAGQLSLGIGVGEPARDGYNLFASIALHKQRRLGASERDFARTGQRPELGLDALRGATFPANIVDRPGERILNPTAASGCTPPSSLPFRPFPFRTPACGYDAAAAADLLPEAQRASALLRGTWRAGATIDVFAEALLANNRVETRSAPLAVAPVGNAAGTPLYPAGGPYYPSAFAAANGLSGNLVVAYLPSELGPKLNSVRSDAQRYVVGAEGQAAGWAFDVAAVYSLNTQELFYGGSWLHIGRFIPALRTGLINPWGPSAPEGQALLASTTYQGTPQSARGSTSLAHGAVSRELTRLPAGPMAIALGAEARRERLSYDWDPAVLTGGFVPGANVPQSKTGARDVHALYAELKLPIARGLDAQLAARLDDYSDFGSTTNPKLALRWQAHDELLLRGSWGTGFRAPPLYALDAPPGVTRLVAGRPDPVRCPVTGTVNDCFIVVQAYAGGNPLLQPETSTQWNLGVVWQPARGVALSVDHWRIRHDGIIAPLDPEDALTYQARFNDRIIRGPVDPAFPALPGPIIGLNLSPINLGTTKTAGFDVTLNAAAPRNEWGVLRAGVQGSYVTRYETQINGVQFVSLLGSAVNGAPIPRWRSTLTLDWSRDPWGATLAQVYSHGYTDQQPGPDGAPRQVGALSTWDLQLRTTAIASWRWAIGVQNLFDRDPPASNQIRTTQAGYNPQLASPLGRTFYLRGTYDFE
jgi:iron complex outermembrane recepter protein